MSRNLLRFSIRNYAISIRLFSNSSSRSLASNTKFINVQKESEKEILTLVYQKQFDLALERLKEIEKRTLTEKKNAYFRIRLVSHLISNGYGTCLDLLDNLHDEFISDEQFSVALERILNSGNLENAVEKAGEFYKKVVNYGIHRKRNRDLLIHKIIQKATMSTSMSFDSIWNLYNELSITEPLNLTIKEEKIRQKLHPASLWEIIKSVNSLPKTNEKKNALKILKTFIDSNGSSVQKGCLNNLWLLYNNQVIEFADALLVSGESFNQDYIEYVLIISANTKEPRLLDCFLNYPNFFQHKPEMLAKICETLALILGKNGDSKGLEMLYKKILHIYKEHPQVFHVTYFKKTLYRISHFFKCSNMVCPEDLSEVLKRLY
uniref:Pentatricopeptide repeat-containing protein n=1 Tax=Panagrolaimus sp. ES5 TaxID=591445 RepID=A0AC34GNS5_9BILA